MPSIIPTCILNEKILISSFSFCPTASSFPPFWLSRHQFSVTHVSNQRKINVPYAAATNAKSHQSCLSLCNPIDGSPPGSPIPGILQARPLECGAISFSNAWKWKVKVKSLSHVQLFATPWTAAYQTPLSMGFSRQECWSGVPLPSLLHIWGYWYFS